VGVKRRDANNVCKRAEHTLSQRATTIRKANKMKEKKGSRDKRGGQDATTTTTTTNDPHSAKTAIAQQACHSAHVSGKIGLVPNLRR